MGNYEELKAAVASVIKTNGNQEITGQVLQNTLTTLISQIGANATFAGIATPNTSPGVPDANVFYIANIPGVYPNFNAIVANSVVILRNNTTGWEAIDTGIAVANGVIDNLYYDPNFTQGVGAFNLSVSGYPYAMQSNDGLRNWLQLVPSPNFLFINILNSLADADLSVGDYINVSMDIDKTADVTGTVVLFYGTDNWNNRIDLTTVPSGKSTLNISGAVIPANAAYLRIRVQTTAGTFKFTNVRVSSNGKSLVNKPTDYSAIITELTPQKNLFNKDTIIPGKYLSANGEIIELARIGYSDLIKVEPGQSYVPSVKHTVCFYNKFGRYVFGLASSDYGTYFTVPENKGIEFVRVNVFNAYQPSYQLEKGTVSTPYESYMLSNIYLERALDESEDIGLNTTKAGYVTLSGGFLQTQNYRSSEDFIDINILKFIEVNILGHEAVSTFSFWDKNKAFISGITVPVGSYVTTDMIEYPVNAVYFKISVDARVQNTIRISLNLPNLMSKQLIGQGGGTVVNVDNITLQNIDGVISIKDNGVDETKLSQAVMDKLNAERVINNIGNITVTGSSYVYIATDYVNNDGNIPGKENTIAQFQAMIDAAAVTGGVIFFPDGYYKCTTSVAGAIVMKDNVHLVGSATKAVTLEMQADIEGVYTIYHSGAAITFSISNMTLLRTTSGALITPDDNNMGRRCNLRVDSPSTVRLYNVDIVNDNFNDGYDPELNNFRASKAAYIAVDLTNNIDFRAYNCNIVSTAWGLFMINANGYAEWNGYIRSWYKGTGIHGTNSKIVINGTVDTYGAGSFACISCSGGNTIVNGELKRIDEVNTSVSYTSHAIYVGSDDPSTVIVNGRIITNCGVVAGNDGIVQINGNIYCIPYSYINTPTLFILGKYNVGIKTLVNGNIYSDKTAEVYLCSLTKTAQLRIVGNIDLRGGGTIGNSTESERCLLEINGICKLVGARSFRLYSGRLKLSGLFLHSSQWEFLQIVQRANKELNIANALIKKNDMPDTDDKGNVIATTNTSGMIAVHSGASELAESFVADTTYIGDSQVCTGLTLTMDFTNFKSNVPLGTAVKDNFLTVY